MISEWLKLMLEEIARKREEDKRAREQGSSRDAANERSGDTRENQ
jgi:hypothetical protein